MKTYRRARRFSLLLALVVLCVGAATLGAPRLASADPLLGPSRAQVERALSAYESVPSGDLLVRRFGPTVVEMLVEIVERPGKNVLARNRALSALRVFATAPVKRALGAAVARNVSGKTALQRFMLAQALPSYAAVVGPSSLATLQPLLTHAHVDVRRAALEALRLSRAKSARALIAARARLDRSALVRHAAKRTLRRLERARASAH